MNNEFDELLVKIMIKISYFGDKKKINYNVNILYEFAELLYENCFSLNFQEKRESFWLLKIINNVFKDRIVYNFYKAVYLVYGIESDDIFTELKPIDLYHFFNRKIIKLLKWEGMDLTKEQFNLVNTLEKYNLVTFSGPTSFGKSLFIRKMLFKNIENKSLTNNIIFIVPTKALINENYNKLKDDFKQKNINLCIFPDSYEKNMQNILIFTPERIIAFKELSNIAIDLIILDEGQYLTEYQSRNEKFYVSIKRILKNNQNYKFWLSSPLVERPDKILKIVFDDEKEVPKFASVKYTNPMNAVAAFFYDIKDKKIFIKSYLSSKLLVIEEKSDFLNDIDLIYNIGKNSNVTLIYCNTPKKAREYANNFFEYLNIKNISLISREKNYQTVVSLNIICASLEENINKDYELVSLLRVGVTYHHSKMLNWSKKKIEEFINKKYLKFIFCTSTLLEGVDFQVDNIIIVDFKRANTLLKSFDFNNLIGRVGRYNRNNLDFFGKLHIFFKTKLNSLTSKIEKYLIKNIEISYENSIQKVINEKDYSIKDFLINELVLVKNSISSINNVDKKILDNAENNLIIRKEADKFINYKDKVFLNLIEINSFISIKTYEQIYLLLNQKAFVIEDNFDIEYISLLVENFISLYENEFLKEFFNTENKKQYYYYNKNKIIKNIIINKFQKLSFKQSIGKYIYGIKQNNQFLDKTIFNDYIEKFIELHNQFIDHILPYYFDHFLECAKLLQDFNSKNFINIILFGSNDEEVILLCKKNVPSDLAGYIVDKKIKYNVLGNKIILDKNEIENYKKQLDKSMLHYESFFDQS